MASAALFILALIAFWRGSRRLSLAACLAGMAATGIVCEIHRRPGPPPQLDARFDEVVVLGGCVVEPPTWQEDRDQFVLELDPGARARVTVYRKEGEPAAELRYGQRVDVEGKVRRPRNFGNPGAFDYVEYLARKEIYWLVSVNGISGIQLLDGECGSHFSRAVFALRSAALDRIDSFFPAGDYSNAMLRAILMGDSVRLEKIWTQNYRATGTYHALVISGLHVAVIAGLLLFLLRWLYLPGPTALIIAGSSAWLYALVTGWEAPVVRSAGGFTLYLIARYFYRDRSLLNLLAAVAFGFLLLDPRQLFEASFQLSFLSVAAIAAFAVPFMEASWGPLARGLRGLNDRDRELHMAPRVTQFRIELRLLAETLHAWTRIPSRVAGAALTSGLWVFFKGLDLAAISMMVQLGLALPMVLYFHRISLSGISANLLVVPLTSLVVPLGLLAVLTGWKLPAQAAGLLLDWSRVVVDWHAGWEPNWRIPDPPVIVALAFAACLAAVAFVPHSRKIWKRGAMMGAGILLVVIIWHPFKPDVVPGSFELTAIDVGQGDSLFLALPDGTTMMVDGGGIPTFGGRSAPRLDIGEDVVSPYLWKRSIRRLDALAFTHLHADHCGGIQAIMENFRPRELWTGATPDIDLWRSIRAKASQLGIQVKPLRAGTRFSFGGGGVEVLSPPEDYIPGEQPGNNDSLVLRFTYARHSFLLTGDLERRMEYALPIEKTDVLKVAHHGSRTSTGSEFLQALRPAFGIISVGFENSYRNPHPEVIERLEADKTRVLRTDYSGAITIRSDGTRFSLETGL